MKDRYENQKVRPTEHNNHSNMCNKIIKTDDFDIIIHQYDNDRQRILILLHIVNILLTCMVTINMENNLQVDSDCLNNINLICNGDSGCNNSNSSIQCENQPNITTNNKTVPICSNIINSSNVNAFISNITTNCYHAAATSTCTCQNILFKNIVSTTNTLNYFNTMKDSTLNTFYIYSYSTVENIFIKNSIANYNQTLYVSIHASNEINCKVSLLMNNGIINNSNIIINLFGQLLSSNITSLNKERFVISQCHSNLTSLHSVLLANSTLNIHVCITIISNCAFTYNFINSKNILQKNLMIIACSYRYASPSPPPKSSPPMTP
eukprot:477549_1